MNVLPDYMKLCFLALYNTVNEMVYDTLKDQGENILPCLTKAVYSLISLCIKLMSFTFISNAKADAIFYFLFQWAVLCKTFLQEAKWSRNKNTPTFDDYFENAWISVSGVVILVHSFFELNQNITKEGLESLENYHNLLRWPSMIFRLCNDLGTSKVRKQFCHPHPSCFSFCDTFIVNWCSKCML